jgi:hypothetical protein
MNDCVITIRNNKIIDVDGKMLKGECNRCGMCCSVYEAGFPCKHLIFETWNIGKEDERQVAMCNPKTLHGGYFGRMVGCAIYPLPDDILPTCGYRYE